jgi:hypothetical protein
MNEVVANLGNARGMAEGLASFFARHALAATSA